MNKYTPGPWSVDQNMNVMSQGRLVAFPGIAAGFPQKANAQLIAAAPELYEAAKLVLAWYDAEEDHSQEPDFYKRVEMCLASELAIRAAIKKAEGEA